MYEDHRSVLSYLEDQQQASHHATLQTTLPKVLLLAAASEFEERVCDALRDHVSAHTLDNKLLELIEQKAIRRQYHTLFDWDSRNAGKFWSLFGQDFKSNMKKHCAQDSKLTSHISAFMEIGSLRNHMVHNNYASFVLEKTLDEVHELYQLGDQFVDQLPELLKMTFTQPE
ncbi:HEPN domain-containing protein [Streptomyces sp. NPDC093261]|uniref:HEPN domain-containing protein n=1 Tax=Streptomyces sp. NPDC093261 TaxID=3366037 RepID=UPI00382DEC11